MMLEVVRWLICVILGAPSALFLICNWFLLIGTLWTKKPTSMIFPFIAGTLGAAACLVCPSDGIRWFAWGPLLLDVGVLGFILWLVRRQAFGHSERDGR